MAETGETANTHRADIGGILPVLQMPFHPDESIDFDTLQREIDWVFSHGVDGVVVAMVSEVLRMSTPEREAVAGAVCQSVGNRGVVVVSVGAESAHTAEHLSRHAAATGADAVMAIPPVSSAADSPGLLRRG